MNNMAKKNVLKEKHKPAPKKTETLVNRFSAEALRVKLLENRFRSIAGILLLMLSVFMLFSFISFWVTWKVDQNILLGKGIYEILFTELDAEVSNWLGKFGAWISHVFIYNGFGFASFVFPFLFFVTSIRILLGIKLISLRKAYSIGIVSLVWFSIFLGLFSSKISVAGGAFGFYTNYWLKANFGGFGAGLFVFALLFVAVVILFNPNFKALFNKYFSKDEAALAGSQTEGATKTNDLFINNTISDKDILEEEEANEINFQDDDNKEESSTESILEIENTDEEDIVLTVETKVGDTDSTSKQDNEHGKDPETDEDGFSVVVAKGEKELSDKEVSTKIEEFGQYDPKLDLASYTLPPIDLLRKFESKNDRVDKDELEQNKNKIVETLQHYKIEISKIKATIGPTVTLYEIIPAPGVRISKIKNLEDDIALSLAALGIRIIAPIPGKGTIGIEVPNSKPEIVSMRSLIASEKFQNSDAALPVVMGKTITNETFTFDLAKLPHLLVAGATGQGKSVGLNAILVSILYKKHPAQVKFVLIDPKKVELTLYNKIERHFLAKLPGEEEPIITDTSKVVNTLNSLCVEMDDRYELLKDAQVRNIKEYNEKFIDRKLNPEKGHRYMPYIVVLIDEFADLIMTAGKEVEHPIARLAQLARAIGIHLIVATQRPSVNVITGMIKANFPARIAFRVLSKIDSRTILDNSGADQLIGKGDMLVSTGSEMIRLQCGFVDTPEVEAICDFIGNQRAYPEALLLPEFEDENAGGDSGLDDIEELDANFVEAARVVVIHQQGSASLLQRKLKLGYNRAGRIVDQLEAHNIIGPFKGSKAREVLFSDEIALEEYLKSKGLI